MTTFADEVAADSPTTWYRLNESPGATVVSDSSGNGNDGYVPGSFDTPILGVAGLVKNDSNKACGFDGYFDNLRAASASWMDGGGGAYTMAATVKSDVALGGGGSNYRMICARDNGGSQRGFQFRVENDGKLGLIWWNNSGVIRVLKGSTILVGGEEYEVAASISTTEGKVFVNGKEDGVLTASGGLTSLTSEQLTIGTSIQSGTQYFNWQGTIDEVRFWKGTAVSPTRLAVYARKAIGYRAEVYSDAPLAYYRFNETSGSMIDSLNGRNGSYNDVPTLGAAGLLETDTVSNLCADWNGTADYARIFHDTWFTTTEFSIEALVNLDVNNVLQSIIEQNDGYTPCWEFDVNASGKLLLRIWDSGGTVRTYTGATTLVPGVTYHVVATHSGIAQRVYLTPAGGSTVIDATGSDTFTKRNNGTTAIVAASWNLTFPSINRYLNGRLDELAWYGTALSQARVEAHAAAAFLPAAGDSGYSGWGIRL
jgi:hypothetical protein